MAACLTFGKHAIQLCALILLLISADVVAFCLRLPLWLICYLACSLLVGASASFFLVIVLVFVLVSAAAAAASATHAPPAPACFSCLLLALTGLLLLLLLLASIVIHRSPFFINCSRKREREESERREGKRADVVAMAWA